jgi:beta-phosphoglucomutase family hydrolase
MSAPFLFLSLPFQKTKVMLKVFPGIKGLIFDLDGTLVNSLPIHMEAWQHVCANFNYIFTTEKLLEMTGRPTIEFARYIKSAANDCHLTAEEITNNKQMHFLNNLHKVKVIEPVLELVYQYKDKLPMTIGTGASRRSTEKILTTLNLYQYFDAIVTADEVENHKPHPDTFLKCAEIMQVPAEHCQVFEDGELGIQAAKEAGMKVTDVRKLVDYK